MEKPTADVTLYLVTDSTGFLEEDFLARVEKACRGGITLLQLREKERSGREYFRLALKVKEIANRYHIPLLIDDRVDIAIAELAKRGYEVDMETAGYKNGRINAVYLKDQIGGFAVHLLQK